jgi:hypothetical protein
MINWRDRKLQFAVGLFFFVIFVILARTNPPANPITTESGRVHKAFEGIFSAVSKKEAVPLPWITPVQAGTVSYPDGSKKSLWVPKPSPQGNRSNCFYVDEPRKGGASGFSESSCVVQKSPVILERQGSIVVGFVSMTSATQASVSVRDLTFQVPITHSYFLVPGTLSADPNAKFTVTFSDPTGWTCKGTEVLAPGSSTSEECVIP